MTQQSKVASIAILILALLAVGIFWLVERLNVYTLPTREQTPVTLRVVVAPDLAPWVREMGAAFGGQSANVTVVVTEMDGARADDFLERQATDLPEVWIPEATFVPLLHQSRSYTAEGPSLAAEGLVWVIPGSSGPTDWTAVHDLAVNDFSFDLALPPKRTIGRLAACASAGAEFAGTTAPAIAELTGRPFQDWMADIEEAIPQPGRSPLTQLTTRPVAVDLGLVFSSQTRALPATFLQVEPPYQVWLDYPYLVRSNWLNVEPEEVAARETAAAEFQDFLLSAAAQERLAASGLAISEPVDSQPVVLLTNEVLRGLQGCWE